MPAKRCNPPGCACLSCAPHHAVEERTIPLTPSTDLSTAVRGEWAPTSFDACPAGAAHCSGGWNGVEFLGPLKVTNEETVAVHTPSGVIELRIIGPSRDIEEDGTFERDGIIYTVWLTTNVFLVPRYIAQVANCLALCPACVTRMARTQIFTMTAQEILP